jgi:hypothetical protein
MKQKLRFVLCLVLFLTTLLTACTTSTQNTNYTQKFIDDADTIFKENQLDGETRMVYKKKYDESYDVYNMIVTSEKFADISDSQKKEILLKLDNIYVSDANMLVLPEVNSQGHTYSLDTKGELERDGDVFPLKPTSLPFVMPKGDFEMSWNTYDSKYNSLGGILTIRKQGSKYTMKLVMSDGSSGTNDLTVISDGAEIRLTDRPGNPYGDYMYISSTGYLYFCDNQGIIYTVPPLD